MAESKKEALTALLRGLEGEGDIDGSAIVSRDGLLIASALSDDVDEEIFAAMSATMLGAAETAINELKRGRVDRVISEFNEGKLITLGTGENAAIVALVKPEANLGLVLMEMKKIQDVTVRFLE